MSSFLFQLFVFSFIFTVLVTSKSASAAVSVSWIQDPSDPINGLGSLHGTPSMVYSPVAANVYVGFTAWYNPPTVAPGSAPTSNILWAQCDVVDEDCENFFSVKGAASFSPPSVVSWNLEGESDMMFYINGFNSPATLDWKSIKTSVELSAVDNATDLGSLNKSSAINPPVANRPTTLRSMFESTRKKLGRSRRDSGRSLLNKEAGPLEPEENGVRTGSLSGFPYPSYSNAPGPRAVVFGTSVYVFVTSNEDNTVWVNSAPLVAPGAPLVFGSWSQVLSGGSDTPVVIDAGDFDAIVVPGDGPGIPAELFLIYGQLSEDHSYVNIFYISSTDAVTWTSPPDIAVDTSPSVSNSTVPIETWGITATSYMFAGFCPTVILFYPQISEIPSTVPSVQNTLISIQLQGIEESALVSVGTPTTTPIITRASGSGYAFTSAGTVYIWFLYQNTPPSSRFLLRTFGTIES